VKYTTFSKSFAVTAVPVALVLGAALVAACATSAEVPDENKQTADQTAPAETKLPPPSQTDAAPAEKKCAPSCASDSDCAATCPASGGATPCCDLATKTCYNSASATCPKPVVDSGTPPPAY